MEGLTQVNGKIIICMAKAYTHGLMAEGTRVNMRWTKSMDLAFINGPTDVFTKVSGLMVNNTVKANTYSRTEL